MGYKLLLADDSITIQKVVELVLTPEDFQIKAFNDGERALSEIAIFKPHIVLADIDMPKLNGYQLCEKIKDNPATVHIPVVLLVGAFEPFDEDYAKKAGADDFIIKPFESQELISKVKALVKDRPTDDVADQIEAQPEEDPFAALDAMPVVPEDLTDGEPSSEISFSPDDFAALQEPEPGTVKEDVDGPMTFDETLSQVQQTPDAETEETSMALSADAVNMPSPEEARGLVREVIDKRLSLLFDDEFKESLVSIVRERTAEIVNEAVRASVPAITEQVAKDIFGEVAQSLRDSAVSVLNRVVPETVKGLVEREINRITSEL